MAAIDKKIEEEKVFRHQAAALAGEHTKTVTQDPMPPQASETPAANTLHTLHTPPPSPPLSPQPHAGDSASSAKDVAATTSVVSAATGGNAPTDQRALKSAAGEACADVAAAAAAAAKSNKSASQKSPAAQAAEAAMRRDREAEINARIQKRKEALASLRGEIQRNAKFVANTAIAFAPVLAPAVCVNVCYCGVCVCVSPLNALQRIYTTPAHDKLFSPLGLWCVCVPLRCVLVCVYASV